jgi:DNA polymerase I-like protein with 3'-5' exonuclease and polymerase domains
MNSIVQGGAADVVERVMVRCFRAFDQEGCRLLLTVHDSLVWEIRKDLAAELVPQIKAMMEDVDAVTLPLGGRFDVKFAVEAEKW